MNKGEEEISKAACYYRANEGEGVRGWEESAFEAGARWADEHPKSPWISVKDKLPKDDEDVILNNKEWIDQDNNPRGIRIGFKEEDRWYSAEWNGDSDFSTHSIEENGNIEIPTHWCTIPELPEMEGER